jgi:hypothetical protein
VLKKKIILIFLINILIHMLPMEIINRKNIIYIYLYISRHLTSSRLQYEHTRSFLFFLFVLFLLLFLICLQTKTNDLIIKDIYKYKNGYWPMIVFLWNRDTLYRQKFVFELYVICINGRRNLVWSYRKRHEKYMSICF